MDNQAQRVRVLFAGYDLRQIMPFIEHCRLSGRYDVEVAEANAQDSSGRADVIFCEWAMDQAAWFSRNKRAGQRLIVRLHLPEITERRQFPFIDEIKWAAVDKLVMASPHLLERMLGEFPVLTEGRACLVPTAVDVQGAGSRAKMPAAAYNLGLIGFVPQRKRPDLAFEIMKGLSARNGRFSLYILEQRPEEYPWLKVAATQSEWYETVCAAAGKLPCAASIVYESEKPDPAVWLSKIGFILSTSDYEGAHPAVAQAMAAGCIPVIWNWAGADRIYPAKYIVKTPEEAVAAILRWQAPDAYAGEVEFCRQFAREHFDQREIFPRLEALLND